MHLSAPGLPASPVLLAAPAPGWVETTDVIVVGSGVAGLTAALHLREAGLHVTVVTKVNIDDGSTRWAQGGIAAVLDPLDTPAAHASDTEIAGVGLCDPAAVRVLVEEGPVRLRELIRMGAQFDRNADGSLMLTREGGHHANRIVHAGGDATGAEVQRALHAAVQRDPWIRLVEHALVLDLLRAAPRAGESAGRACGITLHVLGEGTEDGVGAILARAVVLATGGMGQIFATTTNPAVSTGDGVALALRAGAAVTDIEFVQFHPTALFLPTGAGQRPTSPTFPRPDGGTRQVGPAGRSAQLPLVSEALRGEGAHLVDEDGKRFMLGQHELAELAPRDVVAKGIHRVMLATDTDHVYLDARHLGGQFLGQRFPTIMAYCRSAGIDPATDLIPVAPACHYFCGGVETDIDGATNLAGLYACGEVASSGVHGANRLASNSLLEGLVFARRIAVRLQNQPPPRLPPAQDHREPGLIDRSVVPAMQQAMSRHAGGLRDAAGLDQCARELVTLAAKTGAEPGLESWEATNLMTVATAIVASARLREESRGAHWRDDFEGQREAWHGHLIAEHDVPGGLRHRFVPALHSALDRQPNR